MTSFYGKSRLESPKERCEVRLTKEVRKFVINISNTFPADNQKSCLKRSRRYTNVFQSNQDSI